MRSASSQILGQGILGIYAVELSLPLRFICEIYTALGLATLSHTSPQFMRSPLTDTGSKECERWPDRRPDPTKTYIQRIGTGFLLVELSLQTLEAAQAFPSVM